MLTFGAQNAAFQNFLRQHLYQFIIDFGISQPIGPEGYAVFPTRCGTTGYFAPEMKGTQDIRVTSAIDIWAVGVIIYEMSVAYKPTSFRNYKYGSGPIPFR